MFEGGCRHGAKGEFEACCCYLLFFITEQSLADKKDYVILFTSEIFNIMS